MKKLIVLSLGGSLIIPEKVNIKYLKELKKVIKKNSRKYKFIIVCGGGNIARKYISALKETGINEKLQSLSGISATRMNARFMNYFFNQEPERGIPMKMGEIKDYLKKQDIIFCGALEYKPEQTSDSTSADIAKHFKTVLINLTNVKGLYDKNPKKFKRQKSKILAHSSKTQMNAKFIPKISWEEFHKMANKITYKPGQHFVLDQTASKIILKNRIKTYIIGDTKDLNNLLNNKKFRGTEILG